MPITRPKTLKELALEQLRDSIIVGDLEMGQMLSERSISEELGVSKSPVREALAQLRDEGLVTIEPQKGARVFLLTEEEVVQICDFRHAIETAAFELALERNQQALAEDMRDVVDGMTKARQRGDMKHYLALDNDFHKLIFKHSGNDYLQASYERFVGKIAALRTHLSTQPGHTEQSYEEHKELAGAVAAGDMQIIRRLLKDHIDRTRQSYSIAIRESA